MPQPSTERSYTCLCVPNAANRLRQPLLPLGSIPKVTVIPNAQFKQTHIRLYTCCRSTKNSVHCKNALLPWATTKVWKPHSIQATGHFYTKHHYLTSLIWRMARTLKFCFKCLLTKRAGGLNTIWLNWNIGASRTSAPLSIYFYSVPTYFIRIAT